MSHVIDYRKWDKMAMEVDADEPPRRVEPPPIDIPIELTDDDLSGGVSPEEFDKQSAFDREAASQRAFFASAKGAAIAQQARQSAVHDELESVASSADWRAAWARPGAKRRRVVEARLRATPALGAEIPLPPAAGPADYPSPFELLWCWGEATSLLHEGVDAALAAAERKPGPATLDFDETWWKLRLGGFTRHDALEKLRRDCDDLAAPLVGSDAPPGVKVCL